MTKINVLQCVHNYFVLLNGLIFCCIKFHFKWLLHYCIHTHFLSSAGFSQSCQKSLGVVCKFCPWGFPLCGSLVYRFFCLWVLSIGALYIPSVNRFVCSLIYYIIESKWQCLWFHNIIAHHYVKTFLCPNVKSMWGPSRSQGCRSVGSLLVGGLWTSL